MLDSPESEGQDDSVTVEETEQEMEIFLAVLAGGGKEDGLLRSLDEVGWERLAELGDKYDSHVVLRVAEARAWEIDAQGKSPLHAFTLATHVGTPTLLQRTAQKAIGVTDRHTKRFGATEEWQARLNTWESSRVHGLICILREAASTYRDLRRKGYPRAAFAFAGNILTSMHELSLADLEWCPVKHWDEGEGRDLCEPDVSRRPWLVKDQLEKVSKYWARLPAFPAQMTVESSQPSQAAESWAFHGKDRNAGPMGNI